MVGGRGAMGRILRFGLLSLLVAAVFYGSAVAYLFLNQRRYLYYPDPAAQVIDPSGPAIRQVTLKTPDGETLVAWYLPPASADKPMLLYFNGNGLGLSLQAGRWKRIAEAGAGFFAVGYRGYSGSTGEPSEKGLRIDAETAWRWLAARYPADRIVIQGHSLGSGLAVKLAAEHPARALILEAPYTSVVEVAQRRLSWAPVGWLMLDRYNSRAWIGKVKCPVLIVHGDRDSVIPISHGQTLYALARAPKRFVRMRGSEHSTLVRDGLYDRVWPFLAQMAP
ncbi:MAG: alpha/beta hydrolase [Caulobacter sp.]|nr:alpha/beta hydrolase [Caulobacter sp.]